MRSAILGNSSQIDNPSKLQAFLNFSLMLVHDHWSHQYEDYPEQFKPRYRKSNLINAIEQTLECAQTCNYFQLRSYYNQSSEAMSEIGKMLLAVSASLHSLRAQLEVERTKPLLPPPIINFRKTVNPI